jgi:hypothetical protein
MNPKSIFNLFNPKGKAQTVVQQGVSTLIISSVALSLVALTAWMQVVLADEPVAIEQSSIEVLPPIATDVNEDLGLMEFFSPDYGAISGVSKGTEALPTIETDVDGDLGLMEFFIVPEAGAPPAIETDADQDIGLMEFRPKASVGLR